MRPNMIAGAICLIGAAALAGCQPTQSFEAEPAQPNADLQQAAPKAIAAKVQPKKTAAKTIPAAPASNAAATDAARASGPAAELRIADAQADGGVATTITGCLVLRDDGMFQLKDTDGEHAPKARSWKSGFIKKGSADIDVLDSGNRLKLGSHVGYRVSVLGTLVDRQMRARSLRATSEPCE
jgi:hypothetical protein